MGRGLLFVDVCRLKTDKLDAVRVPMDLLKGWMPSTAGPSPVTLHIYASVLRQSSYWVPASVSVRTPAYTIRAYLA